MPGANPSKQIKVAIAGLGNCAASLIEGLCFYRQHPDNAIGLLFPSLCGYLVQDINIVVAFDISYAKVGLPIREAIYQRPIPLFGDDIKSQVGTTILHRALLHMLEMRGAHLTKTSQVNIGGNTDFANFVYRAETKLFSNSVLCSAAR